jgi:hypothetical protein
VGREAAAGVNRYCFTYGSEQPGERQFEQMRLQVPKRDVDGRDRTGGDARPPDIPDDGDH